MCLGLFRFFLTWSSIDLKAFLFLYEVEVSFLVFSLEMEARKHLVHSSVLSTRDTITEPHCTGTHFAQKSNELQH